MITDRPQGPNNGTTSTMGDNKLGKEARDVAGQAESKLNELRHMAAEKVSDAASYVRERGVRGITSDISDAATRNPLGAVAVSLGVGYLLGRLMTRK